MTNQKRSAYVWQFDFRGTPRGTHVQVPASLETAAWEQQVQFIRTAEVALSKRSAGTLTFGTLGTSANIIPSSPEWITVHSTIARVMEPDRLRKAAAKVPSEEDRSTIAQFATLLTRQGETIALALVCGAIVGRAAGFGGPRAGAELFLRGISGIGVAFGVTGGERRPMLELLRALAEEALARWSDLPRDLQTPPPLEPNVLREWEEWIEAKTAAVARAVEPGLTDAIARAWDHYTFRLQLWSGGAGSPVPSEKRLDVAVSAAAISGPARLMGVDPSQMTLATWGTVLRQAIADVPADHVEYVPLPVAAVALRAVGFPGGVPGFLKRVEALRPPMTRRNLAKELQDAQQAARLSIPEVVNSAPDLAVLILAEPGRHPVAGWLPSKRAGILVLRPREAADLLVHPPALLDLPEQFRFQHLVLAGVPLSDPAVQEVYDRLSSAANAGQGSFACWSLDEPDQPTLGIRGLPASDSIEDVLTHLEQQAAPTVYARSLGMQRQPIDPALSNWLKLPRRRGEGQLLTQPGPWDRIGLSVLGFGVLLRGVTRLECDFDYAGASAPPDRDGNPRESILLGFRLAGFADLKFTGELVASNDGLVVRNDTAEYPVQYRLVNRDQVELSTDGVSLPRWLGRYRPPFTARWIATLSAQEVGFVLNLRLELFGLALLRLKGTLFPETTTAAAAEQPQRSEQPRERPQWRPG